MGKGQWQLGLALCVLAACLPAVASAQFAIAPPPPGTPFPWSIPARPSSSLPHPAVARIVVPEKGAVSYGSGTLVDVRGDYGMVVTNWHVVRDASENITVIFPDGFRCAARVLKTDQDWDLAALAVWRPRAQPVPIAAAPPRPGDVLTIAGYGSGNYRAATGRCTGYGAPNHNLPMDLVDLSAEARQGDSGGPIFNAKGELAGVLFGASQGSTVGSYSSRVRWFLEPLAPDLGRGDTSNIASQPPPRTGAPSAGTIAAVPPVKSPPASSPIAKQPAVTQSPQVAAAKQPPSRTERMAPVAPPEAAKTPSSVAPIPAADHLAAAEFGTPPGIQSLVNPPQVKDAGPKLDANVPDLSRPAPGMSWQAIAGESIWQQVKTVMAAVGVLAVAFHGLRLLVKSSPPQATEEDATAS